MSIVVFLIILNIVFILVSPVTIKGDISYNILKNKGQVNFYLFKFKLLSLKLRIKQKYALLTTKKGKTFLIPLINEASSIGGGVEVVDLGLILFQKTTINTLKISVSAGIENDPFKTVLLYGLLEILNTSLLSILKTKKLATVVKNYVKPVYNKDTGTIYISSSLTFCLYDYIWGFILYKLKLLKVGKKI
ncbi:MAG: hypothetical protein E7359_04110 [Clostridiales bacterium]|nr:hypothetical protein [Clostridiales bacterium]